MTQYYSRSHLVSHIAQTLAYNAGLFGRAQALRREGKAPKTLGIADDLPDRFAYQQLQQLSGMARKVQDAIEHNKRVFEQRVLSEDMHIKKKVFHGWRAARFGTLAKQQVRELHGNIGGAGQGRVFSSRPSALCNSNIQFLSHDSCSSVCLHGCSASAWPRPSLPGRTGLVR